MTNINKVRIIELENSIYNKKEVENLVGTFNICQENEQYNNKKGVLRGLHYQVEPYSQAKLIRVVKGSILNIVVNLKKDSETYGSYMSYELNDLKNKQIFIPKGYAHGYITLSEESIVIYKVDKYFNSKAMRGILFKDKDLSIDWKTNIDEIYVSKKDENNLLLKEVIL